MQQPLQTSNRTILSVGELNAEVNQLLNHGFPLLWVEGEISNLVRPASGHLYFTLKDNKSQIRSAMFRNRNLKLSLKPENGMKVLVRGRVGLYEPRGEYQLIAEHMEDAGVGQLQKQFEALKQKLVKCRFVRRTVQTRITRIPKTYRRYHIADWRCYSGYLKCTQTPQSTNLSIDLSRGSTR